MRVAVAGTFGPIHDGHRALFEAALERGDDGVVVGLASDAFARGKRERPVPEYEDRRERVLAELAALDEDDREVTIERIDGPHGTADTDPSLDALVASTETGQAVADINEKRRSNGLDPLEAIVVPLVEAEDGERISSTRVVRGEVDEHGAVRAGH